MTENTRIHNRFEYHLEDVDCRDCLYTKRTKKGVNNGCGEQTCRFNDIRNKAIKNGRIKRNKKSMNYSPAEQKYSYV